MTESIAKFGIAVAVFYFIVGAVISYFITSELTQFLFYTFAIAIGATSQVALCCLIVFFLELKKK